MTRRGTGFKGLLSKVSYLPPEQLDVIVSAYEFGSQAHEGQRRYSGEAYITHPIAVASILAGLHLDYQSIAAAIMHDILEDTPMAKEQIEERFGAEIAAIVDGVSKLDRLSFNSRAEVQVESFRKMMLAMVDDIRVILFWRPTDFVLPIHFVTGFSTMRFGKFREISAKSYAVSRIAWNQHYEKRVSRQL
jgi:GTP pyrophosphokinase